MLAGMSESETGTESAPVEIDVTDEMIEAGLNALHEHGSVYETPSNKPMVVAVIRAIFALSAKYHVRIS